MAQPSNKIITENNLSTSDYREQWLETATSPNDFATGDATLILSTVPFLPPGTAFTDIPLYPVGLTQSFSWSEGVISQFVPEIGSTRKVNTAGTPQGSGQISKIVYHGNSLVASLYRPTFFFMAAKPDWAALADGVLTGTSSLDWIKGIATNGIDLFDVELEDALDKVVAMGGMGSNLFKIPFGLIEIKRDAKMRGLSINYFEQCALRGNQGGVSAGQFQVVDSVSFEFERMRPLTAAGFFTLDSNTLDGILGS